MDDVLIRPNSVTGQKIRSGRLRRGAVAAGCAAALCAVMASTGIGCRGRAAAGTGPPWTAQAAAAVGAESVGPRTYCNPLDIDYKYNFEQLNEGVSYRSGADPVILRHGDGYVLFSTIAGGYWYSRDLATWGFITPSRWPFEDNVAPAAASVGGTLYLMQSATMPRPILSTRVPETGQLEFYNRWLPPLPGAAREGVDPRPQGLLPPGPWDPALFHNDVTGRWFLYWGSSNLYPLYGIELDPARRLAYQGKATTLFGLDPGRHGWERFGQDHRDPRDPFIEGAWMTKHAGRYYLQYAAPGTEHNVYANGTYVGTQPLGPFTYAPYNPVSYKPGGFMTGAGHGNTFQDAHGNWWNTGTPWLAVNWNFERRIAMFPAGFDRDGDMYADTRFGDFPHYVPTKRWTHSSELFTGWMLLSYRKPVTASSTRAPFVAARVTDEDRQSFWVAGANRAGEWLTVDLGAERTVRAVQVNYIDYQSNLFASDASVYTQFRLHHSLDGQRWQPLADLTGEKRDRPNAYVELPAAVRARYVRYEHGYVGSPNLAVGDLRVFGTGDGPAPATPAGLTARRDTDPRNAHVSWRPVAGAVGYNVRWGLTAEKLRQTYQVFADRPSQLELRALTVGQSYVVAIEAFDENGVSALSPAVPIR